MLEHSVGLAKVRQNTLEYKEVALKAKRTIEPNAVIVSGKADKIFFPEFKVIASEIDTNKKSQATEKDFAKSTGLHKYFGFCRPVGKIEQAGTIWI